MISPVHLLHELSIQDMEWVTALQAGQQHLDQPLAGSHLHRLLLVEADVQHQVDSGEVAVSADQLLGN